jgi:hypothetical protein
VIGSGDHQTEISVSTWRPVTDALVESGSIPGRGTGSKGWCDVRVMMMIKGDPEPGALPSGQLLEAMGKYNEELTKAGVLLDLAGLHPSAEGLKVKSSRGERTVVSGPFTEPKETVAGYWILQVKSMEEAIEWATRVASILSDEYGQEAEVEIRQLFEQEDFGDGRT